MNHRAKLTGLLMLVAAAAPADTTLTLELASYSPIWNRISDCSLAPSAICGGGVALDSLNDGVPFALVKVKTTSNLPFTVRAEPLVAGSKIDPFLAAYCSAPPMAQLLTADDDSGGAPIAQLAGARALPAQINRTYHVVVTSYSARADRRYGKIKVTLTGNATLSACDGDLNYDGLVDDADFSVFAQAYNLLLCTDPAMPAGCPGDLNGDGLVDDADFVAFLAAYNQLICP